MITFIFLKILLFGFCSTAETSTDLNIKESSVKTNPISKKAFPVKKSLTSIQSTSVVGEKNISEQKAFLVEREDAGEQSVPIVEKESINEENTLTVEEDADVHNESVTEKKETSEQSKSSLNQEDPSETISSEEIIKSNLNSYSLDIRKNEDFAIFWKTAFKGNTFIGKRRKAFVAIVENYVKFKWQIIDSLSIYNEGLIMGRSGFSQSVYERRDRSSGFHPVESYFDMNISPLALKFGIVKQDFLKAPLLITDKAFISLIPQLSFDFQDKAKLDLIFQSAIANNASEFIQKQPQLNTLPPLFLTSSVFLDMKEALSLNIKEKLTAFYYTRNLSPATALASKFYGNSTNDGTQSNARFESGFLGLYNSLSVQKVLLKNWMFEIGGDFIHNFLASDKHNQGKKLYGSIYYNYRDFIEWNFIAEYFSNQADTSVAYFSSELYGHNNREGVRFALQSHFYNSGLTLGLSYVESRTINGPPDHSYAVALFLKSNYVPI